MTIEAKPFRDIRPRRLSRGQGAVVLRLRDNGCGPARLGCAINGQEVPSGWGNWYYRMPPGMYRMTLNLAPPMNLDIEVRGGSLFDISIECNDSNGVPYAVRLARQPARTLRMNALYVLFVFGTALAIGILAGAPFLAIRLFS